MISTQCSTRSFKKSRRSETVPAVRSFFCKIRNRLSKITNSRSCVSKTCLKSVYGNWADAFPDVFTVIVSSEKMTCHVSLARSKVGTVPARKYLSSRPLEGVTPPADEQGCQGDDQILGGQIYQDRHLIGIAQYC